MCLQCDNGGLEDIAIAVAQDNKDTDDLRDGDRLVEERGETNTQAKENEAEDDNFTIAFGAADVLS